jgi:hypothetical protein
MERLEVSHERSYILLVIFPPAIGLGLLKAHPSSGAYRSRPAIIPYAAPGNETGNKYRRRPVYLIAG